MISKFFRNYVYPVATLTGGIIGVGFLSLPYIASKVGIWTMLLYFAALLPLVIYVHVIFGKVCLKTPDFKRWPGFVGFYFGKWAERIIIIPMIFGSFGVLLAYLIVGSQFLTAIFSPIMGGDQFLYAILYFLILSFVVYFGVSLISRIEFWSIMLLLTSMLLIFVKGFSNISLANIFIQTSFQIKYLILPYGALLFSLWGDALIPETEEMLGKIGRANSLRKIIIFSILTAAIIYLLFIFLVLAISGSQTTESALIGVKNVLGDGFTVLVLFIGVITTFTAFNAHGLFLKKFFIYDMGFKENFSWMVVCFVPMILFLLGFRSFIPLISFIGGFLLSIDGILILLMYRKIGGKKIILYPLMIIFMIGMIYSLLAYLNLLT